MYRWSIQARYALIFRPLSVNIGGCGGAGDSTGNCALLGRITVFARRGGKLLVPGNIFGKFLNFVCFSLTAKGLIWYKGVKVFSCILLLMYAVFG